jgi:hypothetical protein
MVFFQLLFNKNNNLYKLPMYRNNDTTLSTAIRLKVSQASSEDLQVFIYDHPHLEEATLLYLKSIVQNLETGNYDEKLEYIFLHDSFVMGSMNEGDYYLLDVSDFLLDEVQAIPCITSNELVDLIDKFMYNFKVNHKVKMNEVTQLIISEYYYQKHKRPNYKIPLFVGDLIGIEVAKYEIRMKDITCTNSFKKTYTHFRKKYPNTKIVKNLIIHKMYYLKELLVAISVKFTGHEEETWYWSDYYIERLEMLSPIVLKDYKANYKPTLNSVLDKINQSGVQSLNTIEQSFLNNLK